MHNRRALRMARRATQISPGTLTLLVSLLVVSFISGIGLWYVHEQREKFADLPWWTSMCRTVHGVVNPAICVVFGVLWSGHIRGGWRMGVNRKSGVALSTIVVLLIGTGVGLYYSGEQHLYFSIHLAAGLALGLMLPIHWILARRWVRSVQDADKK